MTGDGLQCVVELANTPRTFYTNGDAIRGKLVLKAAHKTKLVSKITGSVICEEWVHTTQLEFKEHFQSNTKVFGVARNPIEIRPGHPASVSFELVLPADEDLRLPPSFDLKHNSVVWKTKFLIEHQAPDTASELGVVQAERPVRLCRYSKKLAPDLTDGALRTHRRHVAKTDFVVTHKIADKGENALEGIQGLLSHAVHAGHASRDQHSELKDLRDLELDLTLGVPAYGLVQTPLADGPALGLRLSIEAQHNGLQLREIALDIVKCVVTAGKDPYEEVRPVSRVREVCAVKPGSTDLTAYLGRVRLSGFTETFESEWQRLSQVLRITFSFAKDGSSAKHLIKLPWDVPVMVMSEAYGC